MANPVVSANRAGHDQALIWAKKNLAGGVDAETLVSGLMKQGWPEYDARLILDHAMSGPALIPAPVQQRIQQPGVINYASPRPAVRRPVVTDKSVHVQRMAIGGLLLTVGLVITVVSFTAASSTGGTYLLCWGPILFGGIRLITGFIGYVSN